MKLREILNLILHFILWGYILFGAFKLTKSNNEHWVLRRKLLKQRWILFKDIFRVFYLISRYSIIPVLLLTLGVVYAFLPTFQAYLLANEEGTCWSENRKIPNEEMKLRAFTTYYFLWQDMFNSGRVGHAQWEIIRKNLTTKEILEFHLNVFPSLKNAATSTDLRDLYEIESLENYPTENDLIKTIITNNHMLVPGAFGLDRRIIKTNSFKLNKNHEFKNLNLTELMDGFSHHQFSIEVITFHSNYVHIDEYTYDINNCGDKAKEISSRRAILDNPNNRIVFSKPIIFSKGYLFEHIQPTAISLLKNFLNGI